MTVTTELEHVIDDIFNRIYDDMMECNPESDAEDFFDAVGDRLYGEDMNPELKNYYNNLDNKELNNIISSRVDKHF